MLRRIRPVLAPLVVCALLSACSGNVDTDDPQPGAVGGAAGHGGDAAADAKPDGADAAPDTKETGAETSPDAPDVGPDAKPDVPDAPDAKPDVKPDAPDAPDATPDAPDAPDASEQDAIVVDACIPQTEVCDGVDNNCNGAIDEGCPCSEGATQPCYDGPPGTQDVGPCHGGTQVCDVNGVWGPCAGQVMPATEACNAVDDDCSGMPDDGDVNAMCGPNPPHGMVGCAQGVCGLGACDPGWTQYPPGNPSEGCLCTVDAAEPNDTCGTAVDAGSVLDTSGGGLTFSGTLSSDSDADVFTFATTDVNELTTNSYHVVISFSSPSPNNEFVFDVIRGDTCSDAPTGPSTSVVKYDWGVAGKSANGLEGESPCGPTMPVHCANHSSKYFVRVHRRPGATPTCGTYTITVTAQGGVGDFSKKCE